MSDALQENELKALVSLITDEDREIRQHVENKIRSMGEQVIPFLEREWETSLDPELQKKIEDLIHHLQFEQLRQRLIDWKEEGATDLLTGMWLIATYQYPDLELEKLDATLKRIYYEAWLEQKDELHPQDQIRLLNQVMFGKYRFSANSKNFHNPGNSMINVVLETHKGNPISLCVIYLLVAQKLKLPVFGVNLPNLFILTYKTDKIRFFINVFNRGITFTTEDIDNYLNNLNLSKQDAFYEPCTNLDIVRRVFRNLIMSFEMLGEMEKVQELKNLLQDVGGELAEEPPAIEEGDEE